MGLSAYGNPVVGERLYNEFDNLDNDNDNQNLYRLRC
jgi:hypothetical protein